MRRRSYWCDEILVYHVRGRLTLHLRTDEVTDGEGQYFSSIGNNIFELHVMILFCPVCGWRRNPYGKIYEVVFFPKIGTQNWTVVEILKNWATWRWKVVRFGWPQILKMRNFRHMSNHKSFDSHLTSKSLHSALWLIQTWAIWWDMYALQLPTTTSTSDPESEILFPHPPISRRIFWSQFQKLKNGCVTRIRPDPL